MWPIFRNFFVINFTVLNRTLAYSDTNFPSFQKHFANIYTTGSNKGKFLSLREK